MTLAIHVRLGPFSDMQNYPADVCFCANSRHWIAPDYEYTPCGFGRLFMRVAHDWRVGANGIGRRVRSTPGRSHLDQRPALDHTPEGRASPSLCDAR